MPALDKVSSGLRRLLASLAPSLDQYVWLPVMAVVVLIVVLLVARLGLPLAGRGTGRIVNGLVVVVGAVLLLPDLLVASGLRAFRRRPPSLLYAYGGMVKAGVIGLNRLVTTMGPAISKLAKKTFWLSLLLAGGLLLVWNDGYCERAESASCAPPLAEWSHGLGK
ncbi:hypothetical protein AB0I28_22585 [Phytomonospora sp. NPDC050363]|uniref:hypothetical protein n=1 Tax=Phytomonospora sp. NPDC050363 TaxID=3155642 RepID=UPI0033E9EA6E